MDINKKPVRPNTKVVDSTPYSRGVVYLTRDAKGLYYVEVALEGNGIHQSTDYDDYDKAVKAFNKMASIVGDLSALMYVHEYHRVA